MSNKSRFRSALPILATVGMVLAVSPASHAQTSIDAVYFAQTHVQKPTNPYFGLVSNRDALIKAHVVDPGTPASPAVTATLDLGGAILNVPLTGPSTLPASVPDGPGVVQHSFSDSFTAIIPAAWVQPGLEVTVTAGAASIDFTNLEIGAPTKVIMTMFDVQYFSDTNGDYPAGTLDELEAKWPVAELEVRRIPHVVFPELVIPPRAGVPAARVTSRADYQSQTGISFDGEQAAALAWNGALKRAAGRSGRISLYYTNIYGVGAGGQAGGFAGVGNGTAHGILHHELGHALSLPHWGDNGSYPYKGDMHGISAPAIYNDTHAGPTWAFDLPSQTFIPATVQPGNAGGKPTGTYKADPMQGGGTGFQEPPFLLNHFSDYSMNQMRNYLEGHVLVWDDVAGQYGSWNQAAGDYSNYVSNNGVQYPLERDVQVVSVLASISGANPDVNMVYPPIGPFSGGLIRLFDPTSASDRADAISTGFAPGNGCDVSLRIQQGGVEKIYMLAAPWEPGLDPLAGSSLKTEALNLPAADGEVTRVELLLTPDAEVNGLPADPEVLYTWAPVMPDPASFAAAPAAGSFTSIDMTATTGFSLESPVEYLFTETTGNPGGTSSGWQTSPNYTDTGLQAGTHYGYTVTMRVGSFTGRPSPEACATTDPLPGDIIAPTLAGSDIVDDKGGGPVPDGELVTFTVTFSEPMDPSTIDASDFGNAGSVIATIESATPACDLSIIEVVVSTVGSGTLQLQVNAGADLRDLSGNGLDTSSAITDDTVITINGETVPPTLVSIGDDVGGGPIFETDAVLYTVTFSEGMDAATLDPGDFDNAGSPAATIVSVSATGDPAVFEVEANPGGAGTLQLRISAGATLED
ncbi:MAG: hypothetical protein HKO57_16200, partial [Akkermansiaceae bacterium]|nr:hypothetical protein [Akkermansiaceae bacterium]